MSQITFARWQDKTMTEVFPGISYCQLWSRNREGKALVVKIDPEGMWQGFDVHDFGSEEIFVIEGTFNDGEKDYPAGTFIHYPQGSRHIPQSKTGCLLFVFYPK